MCGRYWIAESEETEEIVGEAQRSPLMKRWNRTTGITTRGEIRPTDVVPVIASDRSGRRAVFPMKWGYTERSLLINARSETAARTPAFREDWLRRRCIVPASWYYEWEHLTGSDGRKHTGRKFMLQPRGSTMTWLCGLYRIEDNLPVFVILTREPGAEIRFIHDRMPLILPEELTREWIRPGARPEELLREAVTDMVFDSV